MSKQVLQKISDIVKSTFKVTFQGGEIVLSDSSSKPIKIKKIGSIISLNLDKRNLNIFPFFETSIEDLCKISDNILVYVKDETLFIFIIEIKSTNTTGAIKQLRASYELSKYICGSALRLLNYPQVETKYRGLIFSNKTFKGTSKPRNLDYVVDINSKLKYKHLQTGQTIDLDALTY